MTGVQPSAGPGNYKETVNGSIIEKSDSSNVNILRLVHVIIAILLHPLFQASAI